MATVPGGQTALAATPPNIILKKDHFRKSNRFAPDTSGFW